MMPKKSFTCWFPPTINFDLSREDHIIFWDTEQGKGIGMKLTQFFKIADIVKKGEERT